MWHHGNEWLYLPRSARRVFLQVAKTTTHNETNTAACGRTRGEDTRRGHKERTQTGRRWREDRGAMLSIRTMAGSFVSTCVCVCGRCCLGHYVSWQRLPLTHCLGFLKDNQEVKRTFALLCPLSVKAKSEGSIFATCANAGGFPFSCESDESVHQLEWADSPRNTALGWFGWLRSLPHVSGLTGWLMTTDWGDSSASVH